MRRFLALGLCLGVSSLAFATGARAGTAITTQWDETDYSQEECLRHAASAIRNAGFRALDDTQQSRYGTRGEYTAAIRCFTSMRVVFFVVAGPSNKQTPVYMDNIHSRF